MALFLSLLLWIPLGILVLPIYFVFYISAKVVHFLAKTFRKDLLPLSKIDSFMAPGPSNTDSSLVYTCQVWRVKGVIDVDDFRKHFVDCFLSTPEDRKTYVNLYCYFVTFLGFVFKKRVESLDLKFHISELDLGNVSVEEFTGKWMVTHITDDGTRVERPSWQIKIIPEANNRTTVLWKLHHGICDGYTMVNLVGKLSGQQAPYLFNEKEPDWLEWGKIIASFPYEIGRLWTKMYLNKSKFLATMCTNQKEKEDWLISFCSLDLNTVKEIRRQTKTNFVTVLMSVQIGALRRLMREYSENAEKIRDTYVGHSMGWPRHPAMTGGVGMANHLTINIVKAAFNMDDPLDRLLDLDRNFKATKASRYPYHSYYIMYNMFKHQPSWISRLLLNGELSISSTETSFSSLLCSANRHSLMGLPVENMYLPVVTPSLFWRMKLYTVPVSHSGQLDISINASTVLVKNQSDLDRLTQIYFKEELQALKNKCQRFVE